MAEIRRPVRKAGIQIGFGSGQAFGVFGVNRKHDPLMDHFIHLSQLVALILIDDENVSRLNGIKAVIDQELLSAGNGIVNFVAVMDVHIHGFFFFIKMSNRKGMGCGAVFHCLLAGK